MKKPEPLFALYDIEGEGYILNRNNEGIKVLELFTTKSDAKAIQSNDFKKGEVEIHQIEIIRR